MSVNVEELRKDLRNKLDDIFGWIHNPGYYVSTNFQYQRLTIDKDTETLLKECQATQDDAQARHVKETRKEFFRILEEFEDATLKRLAILGELPGSRMKTFESLEKRYDNFAAALNRGDVDMCDIEDTYVQLALDLIAETDQLRRHFLGKQSILYRHFKERGKQLGLLIFFPDDYLGFDETICIAQPERVFDRFQDVNHLLLRAINLRLLIKVSKPCVLSKNHILIKRLVDYLRSQTKQLHSRFLIFGKSEEPCFGYSAADTNITQQAMKTKWTFPEYFMAEDAVCKSSLHCLATNENVFEYFLSESASFIFMRIGLRSLDQEMAPFLETLRDVTFLEIDFCTQHLNVLAVCKKLTKLRFEHNRFPGNNYDMSFLAALTGLESLFLTLPEAERWNFEFLKRYNHLTHLCLGTALEATNTRLSRQHLVQISSACQLASLELSYFEIESIDLELVRGFKKLNDLKLNNCRIVLLHANVLANSGPHFEMKDCRVLSLQVDTSNLNSRLDLIKDCMIDTISGKFNGKQMGSFEKDLLSSQSNGERPQGLIEYLAQLTKLKLNTMQREIGQGTLTHLFKLYTLDLANNPIEAFEDNAFFQVCYLYDLVISGCRIRSISNQWLKGLSYLSSLDLSNNPIETIDANAFSRLRSLKRLSLEKCQLKSINNQMFNGLNNLESLNLSNNLIASIEVFDVSSKSVVTHTANLLPDELIDVKKLLFKDLTKLKELDLSGNKLQKLDLNCFYNLQKLEKLKLDTNMIDELNTRAQPGLLADLKDLDLSSNRLRIVCKEAFSFSPKLKRLSLAKNMLERLDDDFWTPFFNLEDLDLGENSLIMTITEATFASCRQKLKFLRLENNRLIHIADGGLENFHFFRLLQCSCAPKLSAKFFQRVFLTGMNPADLGSFFAKNQSLPHLGCLSLVSNSISSLTLLNENASGKENPGVFDVNLLKNLRDSLMYLDLSGNLIESLDEQNLFSGLPFLDTINLSNNRLSHINRRIFNELFRLKKVDLSKNRLSSLDVTTFRRLPCLHEVNLSANNFAHLDLLKMFRSSDSLRVLNLADNQLDNESINESSASSLAGLEELNLNYNQVEDVGFVRRLLRLKKLEMRNNKISSLEFNGAQIFAGLGVLTELDLSGNRIRRFREDVFYRPSPSRSRFTCLDLSNNPLELDSVLNELL